MSSPAIGDLWDFVTNKNCVEIDCSTQYIIKWDGKDWVADKICDPNCEGGVSKLVAGHCITIEGYTISVDTDCIQGIVDNSLRSYYNKEEINNIINQLEDNDTLYYEGDHITITEGNVINADLSDYYNKEEVNNLIKNNKLIAGDRIKIVNNVISADEPDLTNYYNRQEINNIIEGLEDHDTTYSAGDHITITTGNVINADLSSYYNKTEIDEIIEGIEDKDTTYKAGDHITITEGNVINADLSDYYTSDEVINIINQNKYKAGKNITISADNVISAADADFSNYYNKQEINELIEHDTNTTYDEGTAISITGANNAINVKFDNDTITLNENGELKASKVDLSNYYNKEEVDALIEHDTNTTYDEGTAISITGANNAINVKYDNTTIVVNEKGELKAIVPAAPDALEYYEGDNITISADRKISAHVDLSNYYNKEQVDALIEHDTDTKYTEGTAISITGANNAINVKFDNDTITLNENGELKASKVDLSNYYNKEEVDAKIVTYTEGDAISITGDDNSINVKYDGTTITKNADGKLQAVTVLPFDVAYATVSFADGKEATFSNAFITEDTQVTFTMKNGAMPKGWIQLFVEAGKVTVTSSENETFSMLLRLEKPNANSTFLN